jgi:hypothetical protein
MAEELQDLASELNVNFASKGSQCFYELLRLNQYFAGL